MEHKQEMRRERIEHIILASMATSDCLSYAYSKALEENDFIASNNKEIFSALKKKTKDSEHINNINEDFIRIKEFVKENIKDLTDSGSNTLKDYENIMKDDHSIFEYISKELRIFFKLILKIKEDPNIKMMNEYMYASTMVFKDSLIRFLDKYFIRSTKEGKAGFIYIINYLKCIALTVDMNT